MITAKAAKNAYQREWRRKNPDKLKAYQARYWKKKAEQAEKKAAADATKGGCDLMDALIPKKTLESWKTLTSPESIQNMDAAWLCGFLLCNQHVPGGGQAAREGTE